GRVDSRGIVQRQNRSQPWMALFGNGAGGDGIRVCGRPANGGGHSATNAAQIFQIPGEDQSMKPTIKVAMGLPMGAFRAGLLFNLFLLAALHSLAATQSKGREQTAENGAPQVTVTLVRWPYT